MITTSGGRLIKKQVPSAGATETVYDQYDRPVYSRDANQLARNVWGFTKYDEFNRPVATGEIASAAPRTTLAAAVNTGTQHHENRANSTTEGYTLNLTAPTNATEANLLTITFYDDYAFSKPVGFTYAAEAGYAASENTEMKSQVTGGRARMLPGNGSTGAWLTNVVYYDDEYRTIQTVRELYDLGSGANERVSTLYKYDLAPVVAQQKTVQTVAGVINSHLAENTYDHADRLLSVKETVTTGIKTKKAYTLAQRYNTLGQLQSKWFHGYTAAPSKFRRRTDYTNNIRGWLTDAKTSYKNLATNPDIPFYAFSLSYNNVLYGPQYSNGNISKMEWLGKDETGFSGGLSFTYDNANRLLSAVKPSTASYPYVDTESGISYDMNGNIKTLVRAGAVGDNLSYTYIGNRLTSVNDGSGNNTGVKSGGSSYSYDPNGNMLIDGNRGAALTYNYLNLPKTVTVGGKTLVYDYDAGGNKHKYIADTLTSKYAGRFEYRQVGSANNLTRVATSEGQLVPSGDTLRFDYFLTDHLGNVRVVFDERGNTLQQTGYYPFGLEIDRNGPVQTAAARNAVNRYNFLGKETQVATGYIDLQARFYDPLTGRFIMVDPLAEISRRWSPYSYGYNNPMLYVDPDGMRAQPSQTGEIYYDWDEGGYRNQSGEAATVDQALSQTNCCPDNGRKSKGSESKQIFDEKTGMQGHGMEWTQDLLWDHSEEDAPLRKVDFVLGMFSPAGQLSLFAKINPLGKLSLVAKLAARRMGLADDFLVSATKPWGDQGLTTVGRALQKHAGREGSVFQGIKFSHKTANQDALNILTEIMASKNQIIQQAKGGGQYIFDKATGRGFGVSREGLFNGFREIGK